MDNENINVALRLRPQNTREKNNSDQPVWKIHKNNSTIQLDEKSNEELMKLKKINQSSKTEFHYDYCFGSKTDSTTVYDNVVKRVVQSSVHGINGSIFMYGQTGSGKTYTMLGIENKNVMTADRKAEFEKQEKIDKFEAMIKQSPNKPKPKARASVMVGGGGDFGFKGGFGRQSILQAQNTLEFQEKMEMLETARNFDEKNLGKNSGVLLLSLRDLFDSIQKDTDKTYVIKCSYIEIYNDLVYDLLCQNQEDLGNTLSINEDTKTKEFYIKDVTMESVSNLKDVINQLTKGEINRHYALTTMNHASSRSHTIFSLVVQGLTNKFIQEFRLKNMSSNNVNNTMLLGSVYEDTNKIDKDQEGTLITESKLNFVDLAGSERVSNHQDILTDVDGNDFENGNENIKQRVQEGQHINKSLFFLTQVISLKAEGKSAKHIPYRNSPLTKIMRGCLGGNSRTLIILCATPVASQFDQTMSTLRFGYNAKKIENAIVANITSNEDNENMKKMIADYEKKLVELQALQNQEYEELQNRMADLRKEKDKSKRKQENLKIENDQITKDLKQVKKSYDKQKIITENLKKENQYLLQNNEDQYNNIQELEQTKQTLKNNIIDLNDIITNKSKRCAEHKKQIHSLKLEKQAQNQQILNLQEDNEKLKARLNQINMKQFDNIISKVDQDIQRQLNETLQSKNDIYSDRSGLLFVKNDKKNLKEFNLKSNWQDLIYDFEGKIAFECFKNVKTKNELLQQNIQKFENNFQEISEEYLKKHEQNILQTFLISNQITDITDFKNYIKQLFQEFEGFINEYRKLNKDYELYKNFEGIDKISDSRVKELETHFIKGVELFTKENNQRIFEIDFCKQMKGYDKKMPQNQLDQLLAYIGDRHHFDNEIYKVKICDDMLLQINKIYDDVFTKKDKTYDQNKKEQQLSEEKTSIDQRFQKDIKTICNEIGLTEKQIQKLESTYLEKLKIDFDQIKNMVKNEQKIKTNVFVKKLQNDVEVFEKEQDNICQERIAQYELRRKMLDKQILDDYPISECDDDEIKQQQNKIQQDLLKIDKSPDDKEESFEDKQEESFEDKQEQQEEQQEQQEEQEEQEEEQQEEEYEKSSTNEILDESILEQREFEQLEREQKELQNQLERDEKEKQDTNNETTSQEEQSSENQETESQTSFVKQQTSFQLPENTFLKRDLEHVSEHESDEESVKSEKGKKKPKSVINEQQQQKNDIQIQEQPNRISVQTEPQKKLEVPNLSNQEQTKEKLNDSIQNENNTTETSSNYVNFSKNSMNQSMIQISKNEFEVNDESKLNTSEVKKQRRTRNQRK